MIGGVYRPKLIETQKLSNTMATFSQMTTGNGDRELETIFTRLEIDSIDQMMDGHVLCLHTLHSLSI